MIDINELRRLAQAVKELAYCNRAWPDQRGDVPVAIVGHIDEDGNTYPVATIDCERYYAAHESLPLAKFYAAANPAAVSELIDRLEEAENENAKLRIALAEKVTSEATLRDLNFGNGFINATFEGGAVQLMVDALADQFVGSGAPNYIEMQFHSNATGPLLFTLQRVDGKTPHQLRVEAEQERDALRADKATLQQMTYSLKDRLEVAESARRDDYQNWMMALDRNAELLAKLEAAEKSDAESIAMYRKARDERDSLRIENEALRAKITEMEQQEPVGKFIRHPSNGLWEQDGYGDNPDAGPLYALPGAQGEKK